MSPIQVQQTLTPSSSSLQIDFASSSSTTYQVGTRRITEGGQPEAVVSRPLANRVQHLNDWPFDQEIDANLKSKIRKAVGQLPYKHDGQKALIEIKRILGDIDPCAERNGNMILACLQALDGMVECDRNALFKNERFWLDYIQTSLVSRWCTAQVGLREKVISAVCSLYPSMKEQVRIYVRIDDRIRQLVGDANFRMSESLLKEMTETIRSGKIEEEDVWQGPLKEKILDESKPQSDLQLKSIGKSPRKRPRLEQQNTQAAALPPSITGNCAAVSIPAEDHLDTFDDLLNDNDLLGLLNNDFLKNAFDLLPKEASEAIGAGETLDLSREAIRAGESSLVAQASSSPEVQAKQTCNGIITIDDLGEWLAEQMSQ